MTSVPRWYVSPGPVSTMRLHACAFPGKCASAHTGKRLPIFNNALARFVALYWSVSVKPQELDAQRNARLHEAATEPALYRELRERFSGIAVPPEDGVITYLNRQGFNPNSVRNVAKAFLETMSYLEELSATDSHGIAQPAEGDSDAQRTRQESPMSTPQHTGTAPLQPSKQGMLQEVFTLEEGPVTLTFPASLSGESYQDLADHIGLFLRKASRRASSYYVESYEPNGVRAEKHWTLTDGVAVIALVKGIVAEGKIARVRCPLDVDPKYLQELAALGAQRF